MPRRKAAPIHASKRPRVDEHPSAATTAAAAAAAAAQSSTADAQLEQAEIEALRRRIAAGSIETIRPDDIATAQLPEVHGLCHQRLEDADSQSFRELHANIVSRLQGALTGWAGVEDRSGRLRGYGYLPSPSGNALASAHYAQGTAAMKELAGERAHTDRLANRHASVMLGAEALPAHWDATLERFCERLRAQLPAQYADVVRPEMLVAAQPNLHNGRPYLRPHLDEPLHDGFGVVIATVAIEGSARILLHSRPWDLSRKRDFVFQLEPGEVYALSSTARNECTHGVLSDPGCSHRASLNLRFGLHRAGAAAAAAAVAAAASGGADESGQSTVVTSGTRIFYAWDEIDRHWPSLSPAATADGSSDSQDHDPPPAAAAAAAAVAAGPAEPAASTTTSRPHLQSCETVFAAVARDFPHLQLLHASGGLQDAKGLGTSVV
jgi:hypothetical protein